MRKLGHMVFSQLTVFKNHTTTSVYSLEDGNVQKHSKKKNHENSMELVQKKISNVIYSCERKCRRTLCVDMEIATYPIITATLFSALVTLIFFLIIRKHLGLR